MTRTWTFQNDSLVCLHLVYAVLFHVYKEVFLESQNLIEIY